MGEEKTELEKRIQELLKKESKESTFEKLVENEINWLDGKNWSWDYCKGYSKSLWGHKEEPSQNKVKWFFLAHSNDTVVGKPLLIEKCKVRLPLIRQAVKKIKNVKEENVEERENVEIQSFYFFDEKFDKRHDGFQKDAFALDFYKYRIETPDNKQVYLFSQEQLPSETSTVKGMLVEMDDYNELSRTMKLPSLSRIFFVKECEPAIKIISPEELVEFCREKKINEGSWLLHLTKHPIGTLNNFPLESELLHSAQMLSGKFDGYPLHITYMGPQGTRKTMGKGETTENKFSDESIIVDSGNSRLKGLGASYKGTITEPGYLAKQDRIGIIDEIGKMVEAEIMKSGGQNILGDFNAILEHKQRRVVSGNTAESNMQPTAKYIFLSNPVSSRRTIADHVGLIDSTYMGRQLWWVQDDDEMDFVLSKWGIIRNPKDFDKPLSEMDLPQRTDPSIYLHVNNKINIVLKKSFGVDIDRNTFLTIYDSSYSFNSKIENSKVESLVNMTCNLAKEPMRGVWKPRAFHHIFLLIDGLCKQRCLFRDHDSTFTAIQEDYDLAERILVRMVRSWDTDLQPKEEWQ